jgi:uncharacterized SAM-binding protein YcdF (DUF218 family)
MPQPRAGSDLTTSPMRASRARRIGRMIGADGFATLLHSNLLIVLSAGLSLLCALRHVHRLARTTGGITGPVDLAVVLGFQLEGNQITREYARRLLRACELYERGCVRRILVLGGRTGTSRLSEAEHGRRFLESRGVPRDRVLIEENSIHTLQNLRKARATSEELAAAPFVLVTSRYHLARSAAMASGLGLRPVLCAAEDRLARDSTTILRLLREAWFLHWYFVGKTWSRWTRNRKSLAKIS